ncbi:MAG: hypothetical protein CMF22_08795 [Idiomarinaceae bacterium]|nr:hypothetical protein [Idiomarinaceae bacterium]|tara:strand:- start:1349 stop:1954 length:606 start_codon:yes stop_codon:yes gene_type:complete
MKIKLAILVALVVAAVWAVLANEPAKQGQGAILNLESERNLESPQPLACVPLSDITAQLNPVDLITGVAQCIEQEHYAQAADLYTAAMTYGYYDTLRVSDQTAHQALMVTRMNAFAQAEQADLVALQDAIAARLEVPELCQQLTTLGAPQYHPDYMIQHGMEAFSAMPEDKGGLVADFDAQAAWEHALQTVPKCGVDTAAD